MSVGITRTTIGEKVTRYDLEKRWNCDRAGIHELIERRVLPQPLTVVNCGGHHIWPLETILSIEADENQIGDDRILVAAPGAGVKTQAG